MSVFLSYKLARHNYKSRIYSLDLLLVLGEDGLNSSSVAGVGDDHGEFLLHVDFGEVVHAVELVPELFLEGLSGFGVELDVVHTKGAHDAHGGLETFVILKMVHLASLGHDPDINARGALHTDESLASVSVSLGDITILKSVGESVVE